MRERNRSAHVDQGTEEGGDGQRIGRNHRGETKEESADGLDEQFIAHMGNVVRWRAGSSADSLSGPEGRAANFR